MRWMGHVARREKRDMHTGFSWGNLKGNRPIGKPRRRKNDNIKMNLQEVGSGTDRKVLAKETDR